MSLSVSLSLCLSVSLYAVEPSTMRITYDFVLFVPQESLSVISVMAPGLTEEVSWQMTLVCVGLHHGRVLQKCLYHTEYHVAKLVMEDRKDQVYTHLACNIGMFLGCRTPLSWMCWNIQLQCPPVFELESSNAPPTHRVYG